MQGHDLTVWADAKTLLPMRIEVEERDNMGKKAEVIIDDFVFDKELDPKLFALEPPAGYKVEIKGIAEFPAAPVSCVSLGERGRDGSGVASTCSAHHHQVACPLKAR